MYRRPGPESHSFEHTKKSVLRLTCSGEGSYEEHTYGWQEVEVVPPGSVKVWGWDPLEEQLLRDKCFSQDRRAKAPLIQPTWMEHTAWWEPKSRDLPRMAHRAETFFTVTKR